jgi:hypothetical protein
MRELKRWRVTYSFEILLIPIEGCAVHIRTRPARNLTPVCGEANESNIEQYSKRKLPPGRLV